MRDDGSISHKTNRILNFFLLALILIFIRVWFLAVIQREDQFELSQKPRRRAQVEKIERGTIRDRFNLPLAENRIHYSAALLYADLKEIPTFEYRVQEGGKKIKIAKRKQYIEELAKTLGKELQLDPKEIEDLIYGKAALFPQLPCVIKEALSEREYARLKLLEKDYLGIRAQKNYKRIYPLGKTACEVLGYMGSISDAEYKSISSQIAVLEHYIQERENGLTPVLPKGFHNPLEVRERLKELKERAYTLQDFIGKSGIEAKFDQDLRGIYGKMYYEIDMKGNILRKLPGSKPASAPRRVLLTLSAELQECAEELLAEREKNRASSPFQKGGAIVAMDPQTGEILALASYPRFAPEDFTPSLSLQEKNQKSHLIAKWLETENYLAEIWDGIRPFEKELFDPKKGFYEEKRFLTWDLFLKSALSKKSSLFAQMQRITTLKEAFLLQDTFAKLYALSGYKEPKEVLRLLYAKEASFSSEDLLEWKELKKEIDPFLESIPNTQDRLLAVDLTRLLISEKNFSRDDIQVFGEISLESYNTHRQLTSVVKKELKEHLKQAFHTLSFLPWRELHFKEFLKEKREEEARKKSYAKPYTEYLEAEEKRQFKEFWNAWETSCLMVALGEEERQLDTPYQHFIHQLVESGWQKERLFALQEALSSYLPQEKKRYLLSMKSFFELNAPLLGEYPRVRKSKNGQLQKHLAEAFYPLSGVGYVRSSAFRQAIPQGSVFKLVVAYTALKERFERLKERAEHSLLNPLTLVDSLKWTSSGLSNQILGYTLEGEPITRLYKGGKLPRSSHANIGKIDLIGALEQSSNIYFSLLASEHIQSPTDLLDAAQKMGFGGKTGIDLPGEIDGKLPSDISYNKTGLYAFAIGQHSLVVTPLQTAVMLSAIANGGKVLKPQIVKIVAAKEKNEIHSPHDYFQHFPYEDSLSLIGIHFPLFTEALPLSSQSLFYENQTVVKEEIFLPKQIRSTLLKGMQQVVNGLRGTARPSAVLNLCSREQVYQDYLQLKELMVGKTGTAELMVKETIDAESLAEIQNHVWFAGLCFESSCGQKEKWDDPELVVVVYLPNGVAGGREAAPLAAQVIKKWKQIKQKSLNAQNNGLSF